jgi:hypothetical protein
VKYSVSIKHPSCVERAHRQHGFSKMLRAQSHELQDMVAAKVIPCRSSHFIQDTCVPANEIGLAAIVWSMLGVCRLPDVPVVMVATGMPFQVLGHTLSSHRDGSFTRQHGLKVPRVDSWLIVTDTRYVPCS